MASLVRDIGKNPLRLTFLIALHVFLLVTVKTVLASAYKISTASMVPTLYVGDHILVNKAAYGLREPLTRTCIALCSIPKRGDVVVFISPTDSKDFIKRVIAIPGDVIEIRDKVVVLNGQSIPEPYAYFQMGQLPPESTQVSFKHGPIRVPQGKLFVLGDNRDNSYDSRVWGFVEATDVRGRAFMIYLSWNYGNGKVRWERTAKLIR